MVDSCAGPDENCVGAFGHRLEHVPILADGNGDLSTQFGIRARPALVELDTDWRIVGYAAAAKLAWFRDFDRRVGGFDVVHSTLTRPASALVVAAEAAVAVSFLCGRGLLWGSAGAILLSAIFGIVIVSAIRRGIAAACGCFGPRSPDPTSAQALSRIALLGGGAVLVLISSMQGTLAPQPLNASTVVAGGCLLAACSAMLGLPDLWALAAGRRDYAPAGSDE